MFALDNTRDHGECTQMRSRRRPITVRLLIVWGSDSRTTIVTIIKQHPVPAEVYGNNLPMPGKQYRRDRRKLLPECWIATEYVDDASHEVGQTEALSMVEVV